MRITIKNLMEINHVDRDAAKKAYQILQDYNHYTDSEEKILEELNSLLGGYGVESTYDQNCMGATDPNELLYINMGDTYDLTICHYKNKFRLCSWGDIAEKF